MIDNLTQLSPYSSSVFGTISGTVVVSVLAGDLFGFYINSNDNIGGAVFLIVDAVTTLSAVPEPSTYSLMASAIGVFAIARRRNKAKAV